MWENWVQPDLHIPVKSSCDTSSLSHPISKARLAGYHTQRCSRAVPQSMRGFVEEWSDCVRNSHDFYASTHQMALVVSPCTSNFEHVSLGNMFHYLQ